MWKRLSFLVLIAALLPAMAEDKKKAKYKSMEVRHFAQSEGVELSPEFPDFLYAQMREDFKKSGLFEQIVGENEAVDPADAVGSVIVHGKILEYRKGSKAKEYLVGFGAGRRALKAHLTVIRRQGNETILDKDMEVKASSFADPKLLAKAISNHIKKEVLDSLKK